ncbi:MAG: hypothetical protein QM775_12875 [Pirellulales bacterium]
MPILNFEPDLHPLQLFETPELGNDSTRHWWAFYLKSRQEKAFMRQLRGFDIPYYGPQVAKRAIAVGTRANVVRAALLRVCVRLR